MWNVHMFIGCSWCIGIGKTQNWFRYETFYYLFWVKGFPTWGERERERERETHNFFLCWLFHLTPLRAVPRRKLLVWPRRAPENQLPSSCVESQLTVSFQIPKSSAHRFRAWRHSPPPHSHFLSGGFYLISVIVASSPRAREHLHSMCAPN